MTGKSLICICGYALLAMILLDSAGAEIGDLSWFIAVGLAAPLGYGCAGRDFEEARREI